MKAAFFSLATMAISAFAAPFADSKIERAVDAMAPVLAERDIDIIPEKRTIRASADLIASLQGCVSSVSELTVTIDASVGKVGKGRGKITADACLQQSLPVLNNIVTVIADVHAQIQGAGGLRVTAKGDLDVVLKLLVELITGVTISVKNLALTVGLRSELNAVLKGVYLNLGNVLGHTCSRAPGLAYGSIRTLNSFVISTQGSILGPCLGSTFGASGGLRAGLGFFGGIDFGVGVGVSVGAGFGFGFGGGVSGGIGGGFSGGAGGSVSGGVGGGAGFSFGAGAGGSVGIGADK